MAHCDDIWSVVEAAREPPEVAMEVEVTSVESAMVVEAGSKAKNEAVVMNIGGSGGAWCRIS